MNHQSQSDGRAESPESKHSNQAEEPVYLLSLRRIENKGALKGFADVRLFGKLYVHNCPIYKGANGWFAVPPKVKGGDGVWREIIEIADDDLRQTFQAVILQGYEDSANQVSPEGAFHE